MHNSPWLKNQIGDDIKAIVGDQPRLNYRSHSPHANEGDGDLPPAWGVEVDSLAVGYEPVGETSIGTARERYFHSRFSYLRTPADRLAELNEGRHPSDGTLSARLARLDKKRITLAYTSALGLTPYQRDEAVRAMLLLNLDNFGRSKKIEKVALTVIRIVVNYNRLVQIHGINSSRLSKFTRISETENFQDLAAEVELDTRTMTRLERNIKDQLSKVGFFERDSAQDIPHNEQKGPAESSSRIGEPWPPRSLVRE